MTSSKPPGCRAVNSDQAAQHAAAERFHDHVVPELAVLMRVARRLTGASADAEDLVQETLIRAYRAIDRFDGRHPRAWLLTIMRNTWRNMNRRQRPQPVDTNAPQHDAVNTAAGALSDPEQHVLDGVLESELVAGLASLRPASRRLVLLVDVDGLSYREAADVLGVPVGTVMSRLHRARRRQRKRLEKSHLVPSGGRA